MGTRYSKSNAPAPTLSQFGCSHQEPMMRSSPIEFNLFETGPWDYNTNSEVIRQYFLEGAQRAKNFESVFTVGMRGAGDGQFSKSLMGLVSNGLLEPLSEDTNIALLQQIVSDQRDILMEVFNGTDITTVPQVWALCEQ